MRGSTVVSYTYVHVCLFCLFVCFSALGIFSPISLSGLIAACVLFALIASFSVVMVIHILNKKEVYCHAMFESLSHASVTAETAQKGRREQKQLQLQLMQQLQQQQQRRQQQQQQQQQRQQQQQKISTEEDIMAGMPPELDGATLSDTSELDAVPTGLQQDVQQDTPKAGHSRENLPKQRSEKYVILYDTHAFCIIDAYCKL